MVKFRLRRVGARSKPMYRIVVADSRSPRDGAFIEVIGHYNPLNDPETYDIDKEKAMKWIGSGAKATETVERLLIKSGIIKKKEKIVKVKAKVKAKKKAEEKPVVVPENTNKETSE
jgi:small subunit ribosomal protein S16